MRATRTTLLAVAVLAALLGSAGSLDLRPLATTEPAVDRAAAAADGGTTLDPGRPDVRRVPPASRSTPPPPEPADADAPAGSSSSALAPPARLAPEGWLVAGGSSPVAGTEGTFLTYTVEVATDVGRGLDANGFAAEVTAILSDAEHGWTSTGRWRLQRIDDPAVATIRILVAEPALVDELCAEAGLDTIGRYSCWNGAFAALNADRWFDGVPHVPELELYRTYLVNHEVGHGLGYRHETCPEPGALAPLMMQLTMGTQGCRPNAVPFP